MVYTVRFAGGRGGRSQLEHELRRLDIVQKNSRPNPPTTCGKVERFQQTLKKWLRAQPQQPASIAENPASSPRNSGACFNAKLRGFSPSRSTFTDSPRIDVFSRYGVVTRRSRLVGPE